MDSDLTLVIGQINARFDTMNHRIELAEVEHLRRVTESETVIRENLQQVDRRIQAIDGRLNTWGGVLMALGAIGGVVVTLAGIAAGWWHTIWPK